MWHGPSCTNPSFLNSQAAVCCCIHSPQIKTKIAALKTTLYTKPYTSESSKFWVESWGHGSFMRLRHGDQLRKAPGAKSERSRVEPDRVVEMRPTFCFIKNARKFYIFRLLPTIKNGWLVNWLTTVSQLTKLKKKNPFPASQKLRFLCFISLWIELVLACWLDKTRNSKIILRIWLKDKL